MLKILPSFLVALFFLVACVSDSEDTSTEEKNQLTIKSSSKVAIDLPKTVENAQPIPALLVNMTFDNENATVTEGIQTSVYGLDWQLPALDTDLIINEIVLQEPLPFDFSMEFRQPLEPCGDEFSVVFNYVADGQSTVFTSPEPFRFYNCPKCLEAVILKYKEGTYSDA
ncbi:MAG: hypothetical protein AB8B69_10870, partial [Chitinophagales bacterium]